jgi:murein L,D-transpeptidase YafK
MSSRSAATVLIAAVAAGCAERQSVIPNASRGATSHTVDRVIVRKGERKLLLMHGNVIVHSYHVELGSNPIGRKERSGDSRTPEGVYRLEYRNPHSDYFLSIQVSYPNAADLERARAHHWDAGGSIMIHGRPNHLKREPKYYESHDWTDGCIALSNADMADIWKLTPDNAPIEILP